MSGNAKFRLKSFSNQEVLQCNKITADEKRFECTSAMYTRGHKYLTPLRVSTTQQLLLRPWDTRRLRAKFKRCLEIIRFSGEKKALHSKY